MNTHPYNKENKQIMETLNIVTLNYIRTYDDKKQLVLVVHYALHRDVVVVVVVVVVVSAAAATTGVSDLSGSE